MIVTETQKKYQNFHLEKLININKEIIPSDQRRVIEQAQFAYSPLGKAFEKQKKKMKNKENHVETLEVLTPEENKEETKSFERLFPKGKRTNQIKN